MVVDKPCGECGEMMIGVSHNKKTCNKCLQTRVRERTRIAYQVAHGLVLTKTCRQCGKEFPVVRADAKPFCSMECEKAYKAATTPKIIKPKRIKRHKEDIIEIERRIHGVADIPRRKSNYREAKQMYYHAYDMQNAAIVVWVNGVQLTTVPQADAYFSIGKNKARWNGDILGVFGGV